MTAYLLVLIFLKLMGVDSTVLWWLFGAGLVVGIINSIIEGLNE